MAGGVTAVDVKMLVATLPDDANLSEWCRRLGISRETAYKWRRRYREEGLSGLEDRSRAPKQPHGQTDASVEELVVGLRKELSDRGWDNGPASIRDRLVGQGVAEAKVPSEATIWRILVRRGQVVAEPRKRPKGSGRRFQRARPNECWQGDDTGYRLASGQEVKIINLLDDHSRVNVDSLAVISCTSERVWEAFCRGVDRYGVPAEFLNDNGTAYISGEGRQPVVFQRHLAGLGVHHIHSRPYHPQTCGKVERFHQTQARWLDAHERAVTVAQLQALVDEFRHAYNHERPHRAVGRRTPAVVWAAQPPAAPAAVAGQRHPQLWAGPVAADGRIKIAKRLVIGVGARWRHTHVTVIRRDLHATVAVTSTGEVIRELTIDPVRFYQPLSTPSRR